MRSGLSVGPPLPAFELKKISEPTTRQMSAPAVSTPCVGTRTSIASSTIASSISTSPAQLGFSEPAPKRNSTSAMTPTVPGTMAPGWASSR